MRYVDEFRRPEDVRRLADALAAAITRPWRVMEVCGGQTHAFVRFGVDRLLPPDLTLLHGPGCPVCVTPAGVLDQALLAARQGAILCTFGDMLRVPGTESDLLRARAEGASVRVVSSPLEVLGVAAGAPDRPVVFLAVGFETTAPSVALLLQAARDRGLDNVSVLVHHVLVPPALEALLAGPDRQVDGLLAAGHVCAVDGTAAYGPIAARHRVPIVVTGFEPTDLLRGLLACVRQLEQGRAEVENAYERLVRDEGNPEARRRVAEVFEPVDTPWRGLGTLPVSGLGLRGPWRAFDARLRLGLPETDGRDDPECRSGLVLQGRLRPTDCPAFGTRCTPDHPLGATMVSSEGACAAYHRWRRSA